MLAKVWRFARRESLKITGTRWKKNSGELEETIGESEAEWVKGRERAGLRNLKRNGEIKWPRGNNEDAPYNGNESCIQPFFMLFKCNGQVWMLMNFLGCIEFSRCFFPNECRNFTEITSSRYFSETYQTSRNCSLQSSMTQLNYTKCNRRSWRLHLYL